MSVCSCLAYSINHEEAVMRKKILLAADESIWSEVSRQNYQSVSNAEWLGVGQMWEIFLPTRYSSSLWVSGLWQEFWLVVAGIHTPRDDKNLCLQRRRIVRQPSSPLPAHLLHPNCNQSSFRPSLRPSARTCVVWNASTSIAKPLRTVGDTHLIRKISKWTLEYGGKISFFAFLYSQHFC